MRTTGFVLAIACAGCATAAHLTARPMRLQRVVLYQNGIGYFERGGTLHGETLRLVFPRPELDDVLKTLTVIDHGGSGVATVAVEPGAETDATVGLDVRLAAPSAHDLVVAYAVPTPTWKAAYRIVLDDTAAKPTALLQAWAMVNNLSEEDWNDVQLTLATGAPMSFALDLHTPQFVPRPDASGALVTPTVLGPVTGEHVGYADRDRDGIVDVDDKCPDEAETWNGDADDDGCPDRGRVIVTDESIQIVDAIFFAAGSDVPAASADAVLDQVAAVMTQHPELMVLEVGGHADAGESSPWEMSSRRATAIRAALIVRGVDGARLRAEPFGPTQPLGSGTTQADRERNRRVAFRIVRRAEADAPGNHPVTGTMAASAVAAGTHTATAPEDVAGTVRYVVTDPVSIPRGVSTMVSILNRQVHGEDSLLFRPDANAPGSDRHPFRAIKLANTSGFSLEPGPVAIFARGTFVGDGLLGRMAVDETAWIPYAVDSGTTVTTTRDVAEHPIRIVAIHRGVLTVENAGVITTTYAIDAGREPPAQLTIRHDRLAGYAATELPPGAVDMGQAYLVPVPLTAGTHSVIDVVEREPRRRDLTAIDASAADLAVYVEGSGLPDDVARALAVAVAARKDMAAIEDDIATLRTRIADVGARADELRANLAALDNVRKADDLRKRLVASLTQTTTQSDSLARELGDRTEALATARGKVNDAVGAITIDEPLAQNSVGRPSGSLR